MLVHYGICSMTAYYAVEVCTTLLNTGMTFKICFPPDCSLKSVFIAESANLQTRFEFLSVLLSVRGV